MRWSLYGPMNQPFESGILSQSTCHEASPGSDPGKGGARVRADRAASYNHLFHLNTPNITSAMASMSTQINGCPIFYYSPGNRRFSHFLFKFNWTSALRSMIRSRNKMVTHHCGPLIHLLSKEGHNN